MEKEFFGKNYHFVEIKEDEIEAACCKCAFNLNPGCGVSDTTCLVAGNESKYWKPIIDNELLKQETNETNET